MNMPFLVQEDNKQKFIDFFKLQNTQSKEINLEPFLDELDIRFPSLDNGEVKFFYSHFIRDIFDSPNTLFFMKGLCELSLHTQFALLDTLLSNTEHSNKVCFLTKETNLSNFDPAITSRLLIVH